MAKNKNNTLQRSAKYLMLKLDKIKAGPYAIAAGFACGVAISFTPFVGFHTFLAALTAFLLRGSIIASALGTLVGNPWTFPIIWPAILFTGRIFLNNHETTPVHFLPLFNKLIQAIWHFNFHMMAADVWPILLPMMIGCIPYYIFAWILSYYFVKKAMDKFDARRQKIRNMK